MIPEKNIGNYAALKKFFLVLAVPASNKFFTGFLWLVFFSHVSRRPGSGNRDGYHICILKGDFSR